MCGTRTFSDGIRDAASKIAATTRNRDLDRTAMQMMELENRFRLIEAMSALVGSAKPLS